MKEKIWDYILSVILIVFGFIFIFYAQDAFDTIVLIAGIVVAAFSSLKLIISLKSNNVLSSLSVMSSLIGIIFGFILIGNTEKSVETITVLIGTWFLIGGISSLLVLVKSNVDKHEFYKPIFKIIIGTISFLAPVLITKAAGYVIGIILILSGIANFLNYNPKNEKVVYKVKVKK